MTADRRAANPRPVLVTGMFRSGTSLTANLVHAWGAHGIDPSRDASDGDVSVPMIDEGNPRGYWQSRKLMTVMAALQRRIGLPFWDPAYRESARVLAEDPQLRASAVSIVAAMQATGHPWYWKEPMFTVLLRFWKELLPDPIYIITVRHPYDSALSWQIYTVPPHERHRVQMVAGTLLWWQRMMTAVLEDTEGATRYFLVYEQLVAQPEEECRRLAAFLCRATGTPGPDETQVAAMAAAVDPELRRVRVLVPFDSIDVATDAQKALYRCLLAKAADPTIPFDASDYPFYPGWREHLDNLELLKSLYRKLHPASDAAVQPLDATTATA